MDVHYQVKLTLNSPRGFSKRCCRPQTRCYFRNRAKGLPFKWLSERMAERVTGGREDVSGTGPIKGGFAGGMRGPRARDILFNKLPPRSGLKAGTGLRSALGGGTASLPRPSCPLEGAVCVCRGPAPGCLSLWGK